MFGRRIHLFRLFGFSVRIDKSWFILAIFITWSLAEGLFPHYLGGLSVLTYWWMGAIGALGLFASIIFHELAHSVVARICGLEMKGITLFVFGGVAEMTQEPPNPQAELLMAIAGPVSSVLLGTGLGFAFIAGRLTGLPQTVTAVLLYLMALNFILAGFNLLPAFPLDGGRVLRATLWAIKRDILWATRISAKLGAGFGLLLIILGGFRFIEGDILAGMWSFLIGMFVRTASKMSYQQLLIRRVLAGRTVREFMEPDPITVSASVSVDRLVNDYFHRYRVKMLAVCDDHQLAGYVTLRQTRRIPKNQWSQKTVEEIVRPCSDKNTVSPYADAIGALALMNRTGNGRLMVAEGEHLVGIISLKETLKALNFRAENH